MPLLSAFSPCGLLSLSSQPSNAEQIYHSLISTHGDNFSTEDGSYTHGWCYANAMGFARAWATEDRAANEAYPYKAQELLSERELEHGIVPGPYDTDAQRQAVLASRMLLPNGGTRGNIEAGLREILGDDFIEYRTIESSELVNYPSALGDQPMNLQLTTVPRRLIRVLDAVSLMGSQEVEYELVDPEASFDTTTGLNSPILVGETFVVEPEILGQSERVAITAVRKTSPEIPADTRFFFTATFTKAHSTNAWATSMPWPMWISNQAHAQIICTQAAAEDAEKRRRVHEFMHRIVRGVSTWDITHL